MKKTAGVAVAVPTIATVPLMGEDAPSNKATIGFVGTGNNGTNWMGRFLGDRRNTIGGGSREIQRNIIATRGLGLPRG